MICCSKESIKVKIPLPLPKMMQLDDQRSDEGAIKE